MAATYVAIASTTVGSGGASNIEFTSIPGTYTDLVLKISARTSNNVSLHYGSIFITVNNNTGTIYDNIRTLAYGTTGASYADSGDVSFSSATDGSSATANTFGSNEWYFCNYASGASKTISNEYVVETNDTSNNLLAMVAYLARTNSAITSIKIAPTSGQTLVQYSTATLYGIKNS